MGEREVRAWKHATERVQQTGRVAVRQLDWWKTRDTSLMSDLDVAMPTGWRWDAHANRLCRSAVRNASIRAIRDVAPLRRVDPMPGSEEHQHDAITHLLRMGHGVAFGYVPDGSMPTDVDLLCGLGVDRPPTEPSAPVVVPPVGTPHPVRFAWRRPVGGGHALTRSEIQGTMSEVDPAEAPLVASLRTAGCDLPVRLHLGGFLRPVLAPGGWDHADVPTYLAAVRDGVAWGDDPYRPWPAHTPFLPIDHYAAPEPVRLGAREARALQDQALLASVSIRQIVVIDGVVHRPCPAPVAVSAKFAAGHTHGVTSHVSGLSWSIPGQLAMHQDMTGRREWPTCAGIQDWCGRASVRPGPWVPLDLLGRVETFADLARTCPAPFEVVAPHLWPADRGWALANLADAVDAAVRMMPEGVGAGVADRVRPLADDARWGRHVEAPTLPDDFLYRLHDGFRFAVLDDVTSSLAAEPALQDEGLFDLDLGP